MECRISYAKDSQRTKSKITILYYVVFRYESPLNSEDKLGESSENVKYSCKKKDSEALKLDWSAVIDWPRLPGLGKPQRPVFSLN